MLAMKPVPKDIRALRQYRNSRLYRSLTRTLRVYNRLLLERLHDRGFTDFAPSFPAILSNLDTRGTRIGVLAMRGGVSRQAAGQLIREIARCGYVELRAARDDARATTVHFTARGRRLLATVFELVDEIERDFARALEPGGYDAVRDGLLRIADAVDAGGALGSGDRP
jgi:DNA-binding MarR family transcriptional regulator